MAGRFQGGLWRVTFGVDYGGSPSGWIMGGHLRGRLWRVAFRVDYGGSPSGWIMGGPPSGRIMAGRLRGGRSVLSREHKTSRLSRHLSAITAPCLLSTHRNLSLFQLLIDEIFWSSFSIVHTCSAVYTCNNVLNKQFFEQWH